VHALKEAQQWNFAHQLPPSNPSSVVLRTLFLVSETPTPVLGPPYFLTFVFIDLLFALFWLKAVNIPDF